MTTNPPPMAKFLLVGVGAHARRTYVPHLKTLREEGRAILTAAVDLDTPNKHIVIEYTQRMCPDTELVLIPPFTGAMPAETAGLLNQAVRGLGISCVIISTEPLAHKSYGLWAISQGLNVIMDKPVSTREFVCTDLNQAHGIAEDYQELQTAYQDLQRHKETFFLINSHRRYHPGFYCTFDMIKEIQEKTGCPVTNIISTHCDGMWRLPTEIVDQRYHPFNTGYGKLSHSGYHFFDCVYNFMRAGWTEDKRPDKIEVVSSFILPNGFLTCFNREDHDRVFGAEEYAKFAKYSDEELRKIMPSMGEIDAAIQVTFYRGGDAIALAQINLQHNGFSRRSWLQPGMDLYKVVIDSRQANDKHDRSIPSTSKLGSDNHFEVHNFRNCDLVGEKSPLQSFTVADLDRRYNTLLPGIYSENVKRGILWEAVDYLNGGKTLDQMTSNLPDHAVPAHIMSAAYISHIRRRGGLDPVVPINLSYARSDGLPEASIPETAYHPAGPAQLAAKPPLTEGQAIPINGNTHTSHNTSPPKKNQVGAHDSVLPEAQTPIEAAKFGLDVALDSLHGIKAVLDRLADSKHSPGFLSEGDNIPLLGVASLKGEKEIDLEQLAILNGTPMINGNNFQNGHRELVV
ncbi:hypothetical protein G7Y89_g3401 [Cudoniella acicularis]|uniref:Gfo/Idh/MocA-like oxidoreductase N-terminal domain-containing protein n=1 Tax=Cudoniella acicularis TaxID=354080 RepID=A0A8H4RTA8_9HELO|nr:hypothetical protein G7Y89_g3401 [Cudoniella acicularis]